MCRDPAAQFKFEATYEQCHAAWAIATKQIKYAKEASEADLRSVTWSAQRRTSLEEVASQ